MQYLILNLSDPNCIYDLGCCLFKANFALRRLHHTFLIIRTTHVLLSNSTPYHYIYITSECIVESIQDIHQALPTRVTTHTHTHCVTTSSLMRVQAASLNPFLWYLYLCVCLCLFTGHTIVLTCVLHPLSVAHSSSSGFSGTYTHTVGRTIRYYLLLNGGSSLLWRGLDNH